MLWSTCWWEQTRIPTKLSTGLSLVCWGSRTAWLKLAPRGKIRECHRKKGWLISLMFNELPQIRIGVRTAKPSLFYSLQDPQVHQAEWQGWDPPLMLECQLKDHFFHLGLFGILDWADLLPLACGLREGRGHCCPGCCSISWMMSLCKLVLPYSCSGAKEGNALMRSLSWPGATIWAQRQRMKSQLSLGSEV